MKISTPCGAKGYLILFPLLFLGLWGGRNCSQQPVYNAHHYVYEYGRYVPQTYRYDPYPNYRAFTHNFPPHYTARGLSYYEGLDHGRLRKYERADNTFYP